MRILIGNGNGAFHIFTANPQKNPTTTNEEMTNQSVKTINNAKQENQAYSYLLTMQHNKTTTKS